MKCKHISIVANLCMQAFCQKCAAFLESQPRHCHTKQELYRRHTKQELYRRYAIIGIVTYNNY